MSKIGWPAQCDECRHFIPWPDPCAEVPSGYNPCARKHRMSLRLPIGPTDQNWGFYRPGCGDRSVASAEAPPTPLPPPLSNRTATYSKLAFAQAGHPP